MRVFFLNYSGYSGNSGVHIHFLANALTARGVECFVVLPDGPVNLNYFGTPHYRVLTYEELAYLAQSQSSLFQNALLHAWTPREKVRPFTVLLAQLTGCPYLVHLEDNEEYICEAFYGHSFAELTRMCEEFSFQPAPFFSHPLRYRDFLKKAAGVTCIVEELVSFVPEGVPSQVFWPACEDAFFRLPSTPNRKVRAQLGLGADETVLAYPGGFSAINEQGMNALYLSLAFLAGRGHRVRLIRAGDEYNGALPAVCEVRDHFTIHVGNVSATELPALVSAANIVVQPGIPGPYDDFRFPSKLPLFLASGRPLITAPTNLGKHLRHEEHCLMLHDSSPEDIANNVIRLMDDPALARHLGVNGRAFARKYFSWDKSAARVQAFYERILSAG